MLFGLHLCTSNFVLELTANEPIRSPMEMALRVAVWERVLLHYVCTSRKAQDKVLSHISAPCVLFTSEGKTQTSSCLCLRHLPAGVCGKACQHSTSLLFPRLNHLRTTGPSSMVYCFGEVHSTQVTQNG